MLCPVSYVALVLGFVCVLCYHQPGSFLLACNVVFCFPLSVNWRLNYPRGFEVFIRFCLVGSYLTFDASFCEFVLSWLALRSSYNTTYFT